MNKWQVMPATFRLPSKSPPCILTATSNLFLLYFHSLALMLFSLLFLQTQRSAGCWPLRQLAVEQPCIAQLQVLANPSVMHLGPYTGTQTWCEIPLCWSLVGCPWWSNTLSYCISSTNQPDTWLIWNAMLCFSRITCNPVFSAVHSLKIYSKCPASERKRRR